LQVGKRIVPTCAVEHADHLDLRPTRLTNPGSGNHADSAFGGAGRLLWCS
jgi:hypothetical protein